MEHFTSLHVHKLLTLGCATVADDLGLEFTMTFLHERKVQHLQHIASGRFPALLCEEDAQDLVKILVNLREKQNIFLKTARWATRSTSSEYIKNTSLNWLDFELDDRLTWQRR